MERMDLFERQWASYRAILEHDLMEHRPAGASTAAALHAWLRNRPQEAGPIELVDLGCGDLTAFAPLLRQLPLGRYTGLDLTAAVLPLAQRTLGAVPFPCRWIEADLLGWMQAQVAAGAAGSIDILHSAFAVHHLSDDAKLEMLQAARQLIAPGGILLWLDVFRNPGEGRDAYIQRYVQRVRSSWLTLTAEQREHVCSHLSQWDIPADREAIVAAATGAGWRWRWAWQGQHQAEALAVLEPA
jgi:SAM-dependent methyltransferase